MLTAYVDGACKGNPGPGGWGVLLHQDGHAETYYGHDAHTTNNRMELTAALVALQASPPGLPLAVWTDSNYVRQGMTTWLAGWKRKQWRKADGKPVLNADLWRQLDLACHNRQVSWHWVRGHQGHPGNEEADRLANLGAAGQSCLPQLGTG